MTPTIILSDWFRRAALTALLFLAVSLPISAATDQARKSYSLGAGDAASTLKQFTEQSGEQVVFLVNKVSGVKTNAVSGELTAREALDALLAGTGLVAIQDTKSGAFAVHPESSAEKNGASRRVNDPAAANGNSTAKASDEPLTLSAIQVSATRRLEPLQGVPLAVSVVNGDRASSDNLNNVRDLSSIVPSLNFRTTASAKDQALFLRGMGTVSTSPGIEPTVSTVVDGVPYSRQGQANMDMLDIDHIEVLRGPQGTLFGKNASAGVVQLITKNPTSFQSGYADFAYFDRETRFKAGVSGPLVPHELNARASVFVAKYDGNVTNAYDGSTVNGYTNRGARAKFAYVGSDTLHATVSVDYMDAHNTTPQGVVTQTFVRAYPTYVVTNQPAFAAALLPVIASASNRTINSNYASYADDANYGVSAQLDLEAAGGYQWTSITAWRAWDNTQFQDQTRLSVLTASFPLQHDRGDLAFRQFSQEIRVASPKNEFADFVAGAFFMRGKDTETYRRETTRLVSGAPVVDNGVANYGTTNTNYALFGEMTLRFTSRFRGLAGLRVIHDDLDYNFARVSTSAVTVTGIQPAFSSAGSTKANDYAGRVGLQFDFTPKANAYLTASRGFKGPAYNVAFSMLAQDTGALKPETSVAYELGLKSLWAQDRVSLNLAVFRDDFSNYQVNYSDVYNGSLVTRLINAGSVYTQGAEADLVLQPSKSMRLSASLAYIDARIDQFTIPPGAASSANINGQPMPFAPKRKASLSAEYTFPLVESHSLTLATNYNWQSEAQFSINQTPDTIQPAYGIWNASVAWNVAKHWRVAVLAKNINDQHYATNLSTFSGGIIRWVPRNDQRFFGVTVHTEF
jgi:iron complex outermembrane receptor protein